MDGHIDITQKKYVEHKDSAYQNAHFYGILIMKSSCGRCFKWMIWLVLGKYTCHYSAFKYPKELVTEQRNLSKRKKGPTSVPGFDNGFPLPTWMC